MNDQTDQAKVIDAWNALREEHPDWTDEQVTAAYEEREDAAHIVDNPDIQRLDDVLLSVAQLVGVEQGEADGERRGRVDPRYLRAVLSAGGVVSAKHFEAGDDVVIIRVLLET